MDISDPLCALGWLFLGDPTPNCLAAANAGGDGAVDISDPIGVLNFLFLGGPAPVDPFPGCGPGTLESDEGHGCDAPPGRCQ